MRMKYKIYGDRNLIVDVLEGLITIDDLFRHNKYLVENEDVKNIERVLTNVVNAEFNFTKNEFDEYIRKLVERQITPVRWAIYTASPKHVVYSQFIKFTEKYRKSIKIFSTIEGCINYLEVLYNIDEFNDADFISMD
jgi:hypothetical protein